MVVSSPPAFALAPEHPRLDVAALIARLDAHLHAYRCSLATATSTRPLMAEVPNLADVVPYRRLADGLPTPVTALDMNDTEVLVKRDDMTSSLYGGNKVRKLEWLLAGPAAHGHTIVTGGGNASHHVLATAIFSRLLDIDIEVALFDQPEPNPEIRHLAAVLGICETPVHRMTSMFQYPLGLLRAYVAVITNGKRPHFLFPGASAGAGTLGYVDCGLEIAHAVNRGDFDEPDTVFCALGSAGTAVGLAIGFEMAGLSTTVSAVRVADAIANGPAVQRALDTHIRTLLALAGKRVHTGLGRIRVIDGYMGPEYGARTGEGTAAQHVAARLGLPCEQTYTAKALAAALDHTRGRHPSYGPVMFLDTASGTDPLAGISDPVG